MISKGARAGFAVALIVLATNAGARADANVQNQALARALFDQGRELIDKGRHAEACAKFEESQRLDPGMGTLFHLANCYEQMGKTASAWTLFLQVASQARAINQPDREQASRKRAKALEPQVPKLVVTVPGSSEVPGMEVKLDGTSVGRALWGAPMPTDPGMHTVEVTAPSKKKWSTQAKIETAGPAQTVSVPVLEDDKPTAVPGPAPPVPPSSPTKAAPPPPAPPTPVDQGVGVDKPESASSPQRLIGLLVGGAGIVGFGVGTVLAVTAKSHYDEADPYCSGNQCQPDGADIRNEARSRGNLATIVGGIGLGAIVGGAVLYLTAPGEPNGSKPASARAVWLVAGPTSVGLEGRWQ